MAQRAGGEAHALVGHAVGRRGIQVDAGDAGQLDLPAGFLEGFAQGGLEQAFVGFQVAGGLVEHHAAFGVFLHQEKAALILDHGGHGDVRNEAFHAGGSGFSRADTRTPARGRGSCKAKGDAGRLSRCRGAYASAARAALSVALGRMAWLVSSGSAW
ncbi:hypothetical protein D3C80_350470 [compost metagenome]